MAMAKKHGARQQKKIAKQKAKRQAKRTLLARRTSKDPTIRLQRTESWPVLEAHVSAELWDEGIGYAVLARQEPDGEVVFASYLVDVLCLGVKDTFWRTGTLADFRELVEEMDKIQSMRPINPPCLARLVLGAVAFAESFGFPPHPDFRHSSHLLDGIDPSACREHYTFGDDGRPYYMQGPNETTAQAMAIAQRMQEVGGHFTLAVSGDAEEDLDALEGDIDEDEEDEGDEYDDDPGPSRWRWPGPGAGGRP
jgi:hypothetical protein